MSRGLERPVLITGGAGFVGTNLADRLLRSGRRVRVYDNLSRPGVAHNLAWLRGVHGALIEVDVADVRDAERLRRAVARAAEVYHLAAQVAVTTSLVDPIADFDVNARGTLNLLEALRTLDTPPPLVSTSTNKVYGDLEDLALAPQGQRYHPSDASVGAHGIGEDRPLRLHSPYGCSKGAADQYVLDYARTFGLRAVVFRMSCIYGPHQLGNEDQGWMAHFLIQALTGRPITLYGDGMQVRDPLFIDDLVDALLQAQHQAHGLSGRAFNIGGGPAHTVSLLELVDLLDRRFGLKPRLTFGRWRPGDQRYYVSDTRRFQAVSGWRPAIALDKGLDLLGAWLQANLHVTRRAAPLGGGVA